MTQAAHNARCYGVKLKYSRERCQSRYRRRHRAREAGIASKIEVHHAGHDRQKGRNTASNAVELEVQYPTSTKLQRSFKSTETQRLLQSRSNTGSPSLFELPYSCSPRSHCPLLTTGQLEPKMWSERAH